MTRASGEQMRRQSAASVELQLSVEYKTGAPEEVFFCGTRQSLRRVNDDAEAPVEGTSVPGTSGIATAEFPIQELGFRTFSLFVPSHPASPATDSISVVSNDAMMPQRLAAASAPVSAMFADWFGIAPANALTVIDQPGVPFADGALLVAPVNNTDASSVESMLVPALTHARFRSRHIWLSEGVAQFMSLIWLERSQGRTSAISAVEEQSHALALAESAVHPGSGSDESLLSQSDAVFYRNKAANVLWQLRDLVGEDAFKRALQRYVRDPVTDRDLLGFEQVVEGTSGKDLRWFFEDWVYHDKGLPDLSIVSVAPRELSRTTDQGAGWLVAVEVRNDGGAAAEVPVTVRSGTLTATERLHINAHSVASTRVRFQGVPEQVQVNDGSVPETLSSTHAQAVTPR